MRKSIRCCCKIGLGIIISVLEFLRLNVFNFSIKMISEIVMRSKKKILIMQLRMQTKSYDVDSEVHTTKHSRCKHLVK